MFSSSKNVYVAVPTPLKQERWGILNNIRVLDASWETYGAVL